MENKLEGSLIVKNETVQITEKFAKREFVLETTAEMYPQKVLLQLTQDNVNILDAFNVGDQLEVFINIRGREWAKPETGEIKYFNSLEVWRINIITNQEKKQPKPNYSGEFIKKQDELETKNQTDDDLSF
jgi:hypothetical protein